MMILCETTSFFVFAELCGNVAEFCGIVAGVLWVPSLSDCAERCTDSA